MTKVKVMTASGEAEHWGWKHPRLSQDAWVMFMCSQAWNLEQGNTWVAMLVGPREGSHSNSVVFSRSGHQLSLNGSELRKNYDKEWISFLEVGKHRCYGFSRWSSLGVSEKYSRFLSVLWLKGRTTVSEPCMYYVYVTQMPLLFGKVFSRALVKDAPLWHSTWQNTPAPSLIIM